MRGSIFVCFLMSNLTIAQPKLVVGIVVDQMKYEYLERLEPLFEPNGGFARLIKEGFSYTNAHYNYSPTYTGPGHASIYTGTTPMYHGIVGNEWYDRALQKSVYCAEDETVKTVGDDSREGQMSCRPLLASTITDELKLQSPSSKVVGISVKDRGSIFPAGHAADAAYWLTDGSGRFISSTYYMNSLPKWVVEFNRQNLVDKYLSSNWTTALPLEAYMPYTDQDDSPHEATFTGMAKAVFPYPLPSLRQKGGRKLIKATPFGNSIIFDFAKETIKHERLGQRSETDFLAMSFSSPDYIGHMFGPRSVEVADNYVRLDRELGDFFDFLDKNVGKGRYIIFLTADHAVAEIPSFLTERRIHAGTFDYSIINDLKKYLFDTFGDSLVERATNLNIYLNHKSLEAKKLDYLKVLVSAKYFLLNKSPMIQVFTSQEITQSHIMGFDHLSETSRGYFYRRSGDLVIVLQPAYIEGSEGRRGTTHGSMYAYDTRVPIIFYGTGVPAGKSSRRVHITDIAPTLSILLKTTLPNASMGHPLIEITDAKPN